MKKRELTIKGLIRCAKEFCQIEHQKYYQEYFGVTDGKAIGTIVEHKFQEYLTSKYDIELGNSANGLDLPTLNTDIKVTSVRQPQSSCPYQSSKQKIYGLGYNLIVFVYQKTDNIFNKKEHWILYLVHLYKQIEPLIIKQQQDYYLLSKIMATKMTFLHF